MIRLIAFIGLWALTAISGFGQAHVDARGLGLCNAYTVASRGVSAIGFNPANLGYTEDLGFSADLLDFKMIASNNFMSLALFNKYFTGDRNGDPFDLQARMPGKDISTRSTYCLRFQRMVLPWILV